LSDFLFHFLNGFFLEIFKFLFADFIGVYEVKLDPSLVLVVVVELETIFSIVQACVEFSSEHVQLRHEVHDLLIRVSSELYKCLFDLLVKSGLVFFSGDSSFVEKSLNFHILDVINDCVNKVLELALDDFLLL
jgi:hypothetical protein